MKCGHCDREMWVAQPPDSQPDERPIRFCPHCAGHVALEEMSIDDQVNHLLGQVDHGVIALISEAMIDPPPGVDAGGARKVGGLCTRFTTRNVFTTLGLAESAVQQLGGIIAKSHIHSLPDNPTEEDRDSGESDDSP